MRNAKLSSNWMFVVIVMSLLWAPGATAQRQAGDGERPRRVRIVAEPEAPRGSEEQVGRLGVELSALRMVKLSGVLKDELGRPRTGIVGLTISLYREADGGAALWTESQNVEADEQGRYTVLLGATSRDGLPVELFTSGEARWVGVQAQTPGASEQQRAMLVSVPYALKAGDAETLGGLPASAFLRAQPDGTENPRQPRTNTSTKAKGPTMAALTSGTVNYIAKFTSATDLGDSVMYESGGNIGVGTTSPLATLHSSTSGTTALRGSTTSSVGIAVFGEATSSSGANFGGRFLSASTSGTGVQGYAYGTSGATKGVYGNADSTGGIGVHGVAGASTGTTYGVKGTIYSTGFGAAGVRGDANATTGSAIGVLGVTANTTSLGAGVKGEGSFTAVWGVATSTNGMGVKAESTASTGIGYGVYATGSSDGGRGVVGVATHPTGTNYGVYGSSFSSSGTGVYGSASNASGSTKGVYGTSSSPSGYGVYGEATSTSGVTHGVHGYSASSSGYGVYAHAGSPTGTTYGLLAFEGSSSGYGVAIVAAGTGLVSQSTGLSGDFYRSGGAFTETILQARSTGADVEFKVRRDGNVYADGTFTGGGADFAELVEPAGEKSAYESGDVLVIGADKKRSVELSTNGYSTRVAGIYSTKPALLGHQGDMEDPLRETEVPLAVIGIVPCKVSAENGPIAIGDLLVTSATPGHAMRGTKRGKMLGAIVGKAMQAFDPRDAKDKTDKNATGMIEVLVTLQ